MDQEKKHDIALMRYSAIAPVLNGPGDDYDSLSAYFREAAAKGILQKDGSVRHFADSTIEHWLSLYRKGGFDALIPESRADAGVPRKLDEELRERIRYIKTTYPRMPATSIYRKLLDDGDIRQGDVSASTVNRYINNIELEERIGSGKDMHRYERAHINEVWCGDSCSGPYLTAGDGKKHRVYIIAVIDDASRFIVGADVFYNDNFISLMTVLKSAVAKHGRPVLYNFDNGPSYRNKQMELLAARTGSVVHYCHPYSPTEKSKIERWFRGLRDFWLAGLDMKDFRSLDELRGSLMAYVNHYNQTPHSSLRGSTPSDRFFSEPEYIKRLSQEQLDNSFLLEIERRVSADNVIVIDHAEYEVDCRFSKQRIRLRYSPDLEKIFVVESDGTLTPIRLLNKHDNALIKREKVRLTGGEG